MSATSRERVAVLRMAVLWLEWRIVAAPATEEVSVLLDRAREALWDGYALAGRGLMRRRQFAQARELVRQALDSEDLPAARRAPLAELAARSIVRQIGRLVATARGTETPEADALDALERGREILTATSVDAVTPGRWHAANRRIWSGYMRLGRRDIVGFELEAALRPLFRALHLRDLDLASGGGYLHPPTGLGGDDLIALEAGAGVDHDLDPITFHEMEWYFSRPTGEFARTPCVAEFGRQR